MAELISQGTQSFRIPVEESSKPSGTRFWKDWDGLRKYNFVLFIVHMILTVALFIYFRSIENPDEPIESINLDLFKHVLEPVLDEDDKIKDFMVESKKAIEVGEGTITNLIVSFFAITAGFHLLYALNPCNVYLAAVAKMNNYFRWIEYAITATIMVIIIAQLSGVKDVNPYILLTTSAIGMIMTGQWFETAVGKAKWVPIITGFILLAGIFAVIWNNFRERLNEVDGAGVEVPGWLWAVVFVMFGFYASFGALPILQMIRGGDYRKYEMGYLTLSLASKASLGLIVSYGFSSRAKNN